MSKSSAAKIEGKKNTSSASKKSKGEAPAENVARVNGKDFVDYSKFKGFVRYDRNRTALFRARDLVIPGYDDERANAPGADRSRERFRKNPDLNKMLTLWDEGILQAVGCRPNGRNLEITYGGKRVIHARAINDGWLDNVGRVVERDEAARVLLWDTDREILVPVVLKLSNDEDAFAAKVVENFQRSELPRSVVAEQIVHAMERRGWNTDRVCEKFDMNEKTVSRYLVFAKLDERVQRLVDDTQSGKQKPGLTFLEALAIEGEEDREKQYARALEIIELKKQGGGSVNEHTVKILRETEAERASAVPPEPHHEGELREGGEHHDHEESDGPKTGAAAKPRGEGPKTGARPPRATTHKPASNADLRTLYESRKWKRIPIDAMDLLAWRFGVGPAPEGVEQLIAEYRKHLRDQKTD